VRVPKRVVGNFIRRWRSGRRLESQTLLCEIDGAMALFVVVLEEVAELSEELWRI
jgi:hypothetical protein